MDTSFVVTVRESKLGSVVGGENRLLIENFKLVPGDTS